MTSLDQLQGEFARFLRSGDPSITPAIASTPQLAARERLEIYSNGYRARLREALANDFPVLRTVLGDAAFTAICMRYIDAWPSTSFTLRDFGIRLAEFLATDGQVPMPQFLGELGGFEWAFIEAFDAADAPAIDGSAMAGVAAADWPGLRFEAHPSVRHMAIRFNTLQIWDAVKAQRAPLAPVELNASAGALIWRQATTTVFRSTAAEELVLWRHLVEGADFAAMCEALADHMAAGAVPMRAATLLRGWLTDGLITALRTPSG